MLVRDTCIYTRRNHKLVMFKKSPRGKSSLRVYSNLSSRRKQRNDSRSRQKAEYLASLPKEPLRRLFHRMNPKRVARYWFSREGVLMALKVGGIGILAVAIVLASLFAYYRKDLNAIRPEELAKRVQTTVTRYVDRNGKLLFEDKGTSDYKIVVDFKEISEPMKQATVALEDKAFYEHGGVSVSGTIRAGWNNVTGGSTQGGSTLTQQLVKKVFFSVEEQQTRSGLEGISRKIKEGILAVEVERMYNKDQILALYLNEVPYGGRRNGVESAARTYFGKPAKNLTLAESSLLASIPQNPGYYNPYYVEGNEALIKRQNYALDQMVSEGYINEDAAIKAKKVFPDSTTLQAKLKPQTDQYANATAPHFINEVKSQLTQEFGEALVGRGGLTVKTTLDIRAQKAAEEAVAAGAQLLPGAGANNIAMTSIDVKTGQIIAMVGSVDFNNRKINGEVNSATSMLEPGSSVKIYDYATLMKERPGQNFGAGSVLRDERIDDLYCRGNVSGECSLKNFSGRFYGDVSIRKALGSSLNIPAVKAMIITGVDPVIQTAKDMGNLQFCDNSVSPGLSAAIGGGCGSTQVGHTNAYATLARGGIYKPVSYLLSVTNSDGQTIKQWKDDGAKKALDPQIAYLLSDILSDPTARTLAFADPYGYGFSVPNVKTAVKTGTTDNGQGQAKDSWMMSYSSAIATGVWSGNFDGAPISSSNDPVRRVTNDYMAKVHAEVYQPGKKWQPGDWIKQPEGIQRLTVNGNNDLWPSWYQKPANADGIKMTFDKISRKKATGCTPARAKEEVTVQVFKDPVRNTQRLIAPDGYDADKEDDAHDCGDTKPFVSNISATPIGDNRYRLSARVTQGTNSLERVEFTVNGQSAGSTSANSSGMYEVTFSATNAGSIQVTVTAIDKALYDGSLSEQLNIDVSGAGNDQSRNERPREFANFNRRR